MGSQGTEDTQQGDGWWTRMGKVAAGGQAVPHLHMDNREEQVGSDTHYATQSSGTGK